MVHELALIDDHHLMRTGLATALNGLENYRVVMEAGNGKELIDQLRALPADAARPAIAIVDLNMPVMDGYATIAWLRGNEPSILPLVLTFDAADEAMVRAVHVGARGYVLKSARPNVLKKALDSLILTGYFITEEMMHASARDVDEKQHDELGRARVLAEITPRELEFLLLVCNEEEFTYEQIADKMGVHRRTVDNWRIALFEKFNIKSKTGLVLFALRWGLLG